MPTRCSCGRDVKHTDVCTFEGCKTLDICVGCKKEVMVCSCTKSDSSKKIGIHKIYKPAKESALIVCLSTIRLLF